MLKRLLEDSTKMGKAGAADKRGLEFDAKAWKYFHHLHSLCIIPGQYFPPGIYFFFFLNTALVLYYLLIIGRSHGKF